MWTTIVNNYQCYLDLKMRVEKSKRTRKLTRNSKRKKHSKICDNWCEYIKNSKYLQKEI